MRTLISRIESISLWTGRTAALLLVPLVFSMVYEVVSRYAFDAPTQWAFEVSYMLMGAIFVLGTSYCLRNNAHVNADFATNLLPVKVSATIELVAFTLMTVLLICLTIVLAEGVIRTYETGEGSGLSAWNPLVWPIRAVQTIGFALFALQMFGKVLEAFLKLTGQGPTYMSGGDIAQKARKA